MTVFFTSDMHYGHVRIIELAGRPFPDVDTMNAHMVQQWNSVVADEDTVYVLGDGWMGKLEETLGLVPNLKGKIKLVPGNHDRVFSGNSESRRSAGHSAYTLVGIEILPVALVLPEDERFYLCHFPTRGGNTDEYDGRYFDKFPTAEEIGRRVLLHGHVHEAYRVRNWPYSMLGENGDIASLNVGVEVNDYRPISLDQIKAEFGL